MLSTLGAQTPWISLLSPLHGVDVSDDGKLIVAVGDAGSILYSQDRAENWQRSFAGTYIQLRDVAITTAGGVVIAGDQGFLAVSTDRLSSWNRIPTGSYTGHSFSRVRAISNEAVMLLGDSLVLIVNIVTGNIDEVASPADRPPSAAYFLDNMEGIIALDSIGVFRTRDGGAGWEQVNESVDLRESDIASSRDGTIMAISSSTGRLLLSHDSGRTWQGEAPQAPVSPLRIDFGGTDQLVAVGRSAGSGFNETTAATYSVTTNTWNWEGMRQSSSTSSTCGAMAEDGFIVIAGPSGSLAYRTDEIRENYAHQPSTTFPSIGPVAGVVDSISTLAPAADGGGTWRSSNRGTTWSLSFRGRGIPAMWFDGKGAGLLVTKGLDNHGVWRTSDSGQSYNRFPVEFATNINTTLFYTLNDGLSEISPEGTALGVFSRTTSASPPIYLLRTDDSLQSFYGQDISNNSFLSFTFDIRNLCLGTFVFWKRTPGVLGDSVRLYRTVDTGRTLQLVSEESGVRSSDWTVAVESCNRMFRTEQLEDTSYYESDHMLLQSTDLGETWEPIYRFEGPVHLSFLTDSVWVAGSIYGRIWMSFDAGASWELETIPSHAGIGDFVPFRDATLLYDSTTVLIKRGRDLFRREISRVTTGVDDPDLRERGAQGRLGIFPNAARERVLVRWYQPGEGRLVLYDMQGRRIREERVTGGTGQSVLEIAGYTAGSYQVVLLNSEGEWVATARLEKL